jgi:hypothetical protein
METETRLKRTADNIQFQINLLNKLQMKFEVQNGTYTTTIITEHGKTKYMMNTYPLRVFKVANMIKSDVLKSENAKAIIEAKYFKSNFGFSDIPKSYKAKQVLNIDITSAYATCLVQNGLITQKTYQALKMLSKKDRLPCVGMLATSHTKYFYDNGECTNVDSFRAYTAPVFFYVIDEINYIMQNIQFLLGDKYIFHWVDGIFFDFKTDPKIIKMIEDYLNEKGYQYKYEDVKDFKVESDERKMILKMIKNGSPKQYTISKDNVGKDLNKYLSSLIKQQETTPQTNITK